MRKRDPRHRYVGLLSRSKKPETPAERTLYVLMHGEAVFNKDLPQKKWAAGQTKDSLASYAWEIHGNPGLRGIFEAFLFATPNDGVIHDCLGVNQDEVAFYREMFFETGVFTNDLERMAWLQTVDDTDPSKELFKMGFHQGFVALRWHYCRDKGQVSMEEAEKTVLTDSYVQYLGHRNKPLTSKTAKEARSLGRIVLQTIQVMRNKDDLGDADSADSLRFKFRQARPTATITELEGEGIEVMH